MDNSILSRLLCKPFELCYKMSRDRLLISAESVSLYIRNRNLILSHNLLLKSIFMPYDMQVLFRFVFLSLWGYTGIHEDEPTYSLFLKEYTKNQGVEKYLISPSFYTLGQCETFNCSLMSTTRLSANWMIMLSNYPSL